VAREAPVGRFGQRDFVAYFLAALFVRLLSGAWVLWEANMEIRQGTLAFRLLRPIHPLVHYAAENVAAMPLRFASAAPVLIVLLVVAPGHVTHDPVLLAAFPLALLGAWLITFLAMSAIAALAFWIDSATSIGQVWFGLFSIFSGYLVPLELFPGPLAAAARWLPFRYMLGAPVELLVGLSSRSDGLVDLGVQWLWVALLGLGAAAAWRVGVRRYSAFGG
jgi:ABC-2 type transport system permease protein